MSEYHITMERGAVQVNALGKPIVAEIGCDQPVTVDKMFGPLVFAPLRVTASFQTCEWIVERQRIDSSEWIEVARIQGQMDCEYDETHPDHRDIPER